MSLRSDCYFWFRCSLNLNWGHILESCWLVVFISLWKEYTTQIHGAPQGSTIGPLRFSMYTCYLQVGYFKSIMTNFIFMQMVRRSTSDAAAVTRCSWIENCRSVPQRSFPSMKLHWIRSYYHRLRFFPALRIVVIIGSLQTTSVSYLITGLILILFSNPASYLQSSSKALGNITYYLPESVQSVQTSAGSDSACKNKTILTRSNIRSLVTPDFSIFKGCLCDLG